MALLSNLNYNTSDLLAFAKTYFSGICSKTYISNVPKAVLNSTTDFMLISLGSGISDKGDYGNVLLQIDIFVKSRQNGEKDNSKMSTLQNALFTKIREYSREETCPYVITNNSNNTCFEDYDSDSGFHVSINYVSVIIIQPTIITEE